MIPALIPHKIADKQPPFQTVVWIRLDGDYMIQAGYGKDGLWYDIHTDKPLSNQESVSHWFEGISKEYIRIVYTEADGKLHYTEKQF